MSRANNMYDMEFEIPCMTFNKRGAAVLGVVGIRIILLRLILSC